MAFKELISLTGSSFAGDVSADAGGVHGGHSDGVLSVGLQLLQGDAGLLPSNLRLFTGNMSAVSVGVPKHGVTQFEQKRPNKSSENANTNMKFRVF